MSDFEPTEVRHHAVIAGTGRAGTTFLVQFLAGCGLDIGEPTAMSERAHAGLEIPLTDPTAPYLTKDPWLYTYCDDLDFGTLAIDVVILPMRALDAAADSRLIQEKSWILETLPEHFADADSYGSVPGGGIYSLHELDLQRLLATGFYKVLYWAVRNQLRVIFLDFPRLVHDADYVIDTLWPWLGDFTTKEAAHKVFAATADPSLVRVGGEVVSDDDTDRKALRIVLRELQAANVEIEQRRAQLEHEKNLLHQALEQSENSGLRRYRNFLTREWRRLRFGARS